MIKPLNDRNVSDKTNWSAVGLLSLSNANCSKEDLGECRDWGRKIDSGWNGLMQFMKLKPYYENNNLFITGKMIFVHTW